jgi:hypothetical protein
MNATLGTLAQQKRLLVARSALCRLKLQHRVGELRGALPWSRAAVSARVEPSVRRVVFSLAATIAGRERTERLITLAGRVVLLAGLATSLLSFRPAAATTAGRTKGVSSTGTDRLLP